MFFAFRMQTEAWRKQRKKNRKTLTKRYDFFTQLFLFKKMTMTMMMMMMMMMMENLYCFQRLRDLESKFSGLEHQVKTLGQAITIIPPANSYPIN